MNAISGFNPNINNPNSSVGSLVTNKYHYGLENTIFKHQVIAINNKVTSGIGQMINTIKASNSRSLSGFVLKYRVVHQLKNAMKSLEKLVGKFENGNASVADLQSKYEAYANKFSTKFDQIGNKLKFVEGTLQKDIFNNAKTSIDEEKKEMAEALATPSSGGGGGEDKSQESSSVIKKPGVTLPDDIANLCADAMREEPLGEGAFGKVYATDKYVFKVIDDKEALSAEIAAGDQYMKVQEEAGKDDSFYIRGSTDANMKYGEKTINVGGKEVLVLERAKGKELFSILSEIIPDKKTYPEMATRLLAHAAQGFAGLHAKGLVHLDIKSENLMAHTETKKTDGGPQHQEVQSTIIDLGMAKKIDALKDGGFVGGTPGYMAPEIWEGTMKDNPQAADVYAFGVTMYDAFFGVDEIPHGINFFPASGGNVRPKEYLEGSKTTAKNLSNEGTRAAINEALESTEFGQIYTWEQRDFILKLISDCVQTDLAKRPTMAQVGGMLEMFQITNEIKGERRNLENDILQGKTAPQSENVAAHDLDLFDDDGEISYEKVKNYVLTDISPSKAENAALA